VADFGTAILAAGVTLTASYVSGFIAEEYRRHLDARSVAAALGGELQGHISAIPTLRDSFAAILNTASANNRKTVLRNSGPVNSPLFEASVTKLGMLGPDLARDVAIVYEKIRAFRLGLSVIARDMDEMSIEEYSGHLGYIVKMLGAQEASGADLVERLYAFSKKRFYLSPCRVLSSCAPTP